ncbi:MAG: radical SAM protein [Proteobacteria bacterium]|nr:radical SAM protein [Pseudomonadota bacterium]
MATSCTNNHISRHGGLAQGREHEQKQYFDSKRLYTLQIESTNTCGQDCIYCYAGSELEGAQGLTSDEIQNLLSDAVTLEIRAIDWLGGDPLMRPDWYDLMKKARSLGLINNVWTSGLPLSDEQVAKKVFEVTESGFVAVHMDTINPDIYRRLHTQDSPKRISTVIKGVDRLLSLGKSPDEMINCITYTTLQGPEDAIGTMRWWFEEKGLRTCLTMFNPAGMGASLSELEPGMNEVRRVYSERDRINWGDDTISISAMDTDKYYCGTMATVTFGGDVTPCSVIRKGVGNIRKTPFARIVAEHLDILVHGSLHDVSSLPSPCSACVNNPHCWGCRASAFNYGGDADGLDPKCWINQKCNDHGTGFKDGSISTARTGPRWLEDRLKENEIIVLDGAMGTELQARGVPMHNNVWSGQALKAHGEVIRNIHEDYIRAGADVIVTNTFSANRYLLEPCGFGDDIEPMNRLAVELAERARQEAAERPVAIAGSISGFMARPDDPEWLDPKRVRACVREQAEILAEAGVDLIALEMMERVELVIPTVEAALETGLPVWVGCSARSHSDKPNLTAYDYPDRDFGELLDAVTGLECAVVNIMHSKVQDTGHGIDMLRKRFSRVIGAYPNSGHFKMPNWQFEGVISPDDFVGTAKQWIAKGAQLIGGCCGLGPEHIRRLKNQLPKRLSKN